MKIADVLTRKAIAEVVTIASTATVRDLLGVLAEHGIGACVVSDGTAVDGIVSERDVVRRLHENDALLAAEVSSIMTAEVETCDPDATIDDILGIMTKRRIRHMPVVSADGGLVGIVSIGDLVKHRIDQLAFERDQLEAYVHQT